MDHSGQLSLSIKSYQSKIITARHHDYFCYSFDLLCDYKEKHFQWTINRTYESIHHFLSILSREQVTEDIEFQPLRQYEEIAALPSSEQIQEIYKILLTVIEDHANSDTMLEFLEISPSSFNSDKKYKEGYISKIGIGRISNQKKILTCWNRCNDRFHVWLKIRDYGIEFSDSRSTLEAHDVIPFSFQFQVTKGLRKTGFRAGIRITTAHHDVVFRAENGLQRDEFAYGIHNAYSISEYFKRDTRFNSSFLIRPFNTCKSYVDGKEYFKDVYKALIGARKHVYITD